jgi:hypothetical protein
MTSAEFEPSISACERLQTHAFDRVATGIGLRVLSSNENLQANGFPGRTVHAVCTRAVQVRTEKRKT